MRTLEEARSAAMKFVGKRDCPPVIVEHKLSEDDQKTWFGFRFFFAETFSTEWIKREDLSFDRMVEVLN